MLHDRVIQAGEGILDEARGEWVIRRVVGVSPGSGGGERLGEEVCLGGEKSLLDGWDRGCGECVGHDEGREQMSLDGKKDATRVKLKMVG